VIAVSGSELPETALVSTLRLRLRLSALQHVSSLFTEMLISDSRRLERAELLKCAICA
jgi:hypothetical protein